MLQEINISFLTNQYYTFNPQTTTIEKALESIRQGGYNGMLAERIKQIRQESHPEERAKLKSTLPFILWQGIFNHRSNRGLVSLSSIVCLDFDHVDADLGELKEKLKSVSFILSVFISPSGNGLKVLVWTDLSEPIEYKNCLLQLGRFFKNNFGLDMDMKCTDIGRGCYASYDPCLYVNWAAQPYHFEYVPSLQTAKQSSSSVHPSTGFVANWKEPKPVYNSELDRITVQSEGLTDENIVEIYARQHQRYVEDLKVGHRNESIYKRALELCLAGVHRDLAIEYCKATYQDFPVKELMLVVSNAYENTCAKYGSERVRYKSFEGYLWSK